MNASGSRDVNKMRHLLSTVNLDINRPDGLVSSYPNPYISPNIMKSWDLLGTLSFTLGSERFLRER